MTVSTAYLNLARPFHRALASASKVSVLSEVMKSSANCLSDLDAKVCIRQFYRAL